MRDKIVYGTSYYNDYNKWCLIKSMGSGGILGISHYRLLAHREAELFLMHCLAGILVKYAGSSFRNK